MGPERKRLSGEASRYDPVLIAFRIERMRKANKIPVKLIAAEVWPHQDEPRFTWYKKVERRGSEFDLAEIGTIADAFARILGRKLTGWPFVDEAVSDKFDSL